MSFATTTSQVQTQYFFSVKHFYDKFESPLYTIEPLHHLHIHWWNKLKLVLSLLSPCESGHQEGILVEEETLSISEAWWKTCPYLFHSSLFHSFCFLHFHPHEFLFPFLSGSISFFHNTLFTFRQASVGAKKGIKGGLMYVNVNWKFGDPIQRRGSFGISRTIVEKGAQKWRQRDAVL